MTDIFMLVAFGGLAAAIIAPRLNARVGRITYWSGALAACLATFLMGVPDDWRSGIAMSLFVGCAVVAVAYVYTDFIVIGGKTYSLFASPEATEDYGGGQTAKKTWWIATFGVAVFLLISAVQLLESDREWLALLAAAVVILAAGSFGYRDALTSQNVAAGQRLQFGLLSVGTVGVFTAVYFAAYLAGKRWLVPRQAYGRHQRQKR
ncbi:hypothetical protein [Mycolicibacterium pulveris]|uniref:hypothetical protein n=1 Tax=Mycolicibacterium pulveris TaxID=36813 RepID=UPI003CF01166